MKKLSWWELSIVCDYAEKVLEFYKLCNHGETPNASDAELAVREYNSEFRPFKVIYGISIKGYIENIVDCIGSLIET